ncbi:MAG: sodium-translocating pyrophosphatase [Candidatus Thermoplasmatota archaeon]
MLELYIIIAAILSGWLAIIFAYLYAIGILKLPTGEKKMLEISNAIKEGAMAYLNRQYRTVAVFAIIIALILALSLGSNGWKIAIAFLVGAFFSALAGYIGMNISVRANVRTAEAAKSGLKKALMTAFRGGAVTGLCVVGLGLFGLSSFYLIYRDANLIVGFGFGASLISLFARVGGGIYTKAADVGADLVGKVETGIPEDDPRNPAVIADNVGDNVGDCAGMGADLFETYVVTAVASMLLGLLLFKEELYIVYPLALGSIAIFGTIIGTFFVRLGKNGGIMNALYKGVIASGLISGIGFYIVTFYLRIPLKFFYASLVGLFITVCMVGITEYYTSMRYSSVKTIAEASKTGPGTNIITGLAIGLRSTGYPVIVICIGILVAYGLGFLLLPITNNAFDGLYAISIAAASMLSLTGIIVAVDSYGPITDNAGGIAEMSDLAPEVRKVTDELDAVGNTTKAVTKGYAIGSAALGAMALFAAYTQEVGTSFTFQIDDPRVLVGLFIGALLPFLFSSLCLQAVGRAAFHIVEEVRRQFKEIPGIMERKAKPDYAKCVDIVTFSAQKEMVLPALLAVVSPLLVGFLIGPNALGGLLVGCIISGLLVALQMCTGGAAWDNAKKYIEVGHFGGKKSEPHKAAVVGDTVGDPFKDTAGPALNALIKVINTVSIIFASLIVAYNIPGMF